ncbi:uncharacterized protein LTR77_005693 [Saxophila tyrrhenica]|uniref:Uncharacterized protein n=1 Tax=Saxophila tyrrhenica TaxID=1690608 RepID=A0AAV9PDD2_9PEZI|nr:hypothetical protein LTR77_005693 [Saxophila tyrrhenica]
MSKHNVPSVVGGGMHHPHKTGGSAHGSPHKMNKTPLKSNITNKIKPRHATDADISDDESGGEGGGSSATEDATTTSEDPDDFALSSATQSQSLRGAGQRLAGLKSGHGELSDTDMDDAAQAVGGAEDDEAGVSDDDDYAGVDNVSDSGEEDLGLSGNQILRSAEQDLIQEFEKAEQRRSASTVTRDLDVLGLDDFDMDARSLGLLQSSPALSAMLFAPEMPSIDLNQDPFLGLSQDADEYQQMWGAAESLMWRMPETARSREGSDPASGTQKRVRFEKTPSSTPSISEDEDPNEAFPDLFTPADDPIVSQQIAFGVNHDTLLSQGDCNDTDSFYDFDDEEDKLAFQIDEDSNSSDETSTYDSEDEGDTTDEETAEEQLAKLDERRRAARKSAGQDPATPAPVKQATPKTPRPATPRTANTRSSNTPRPPTPGSGRGPRSGTFQADPTRAAVTTDPAGGKLRVQPPTKPIGKDKEFWDRARSAIDSREGSRRNSIQIMRSNSSDSMPSRPFTAKSTLGSMFGGNLEFLRNNDAHGIGQDLFPQAMSRPQSSFSSLTETDDSAMNPPHLDLDMQDLVNMDDSDTEDNGMDTGALASPIEMSDSFHSGRGLERRSSDLLEHFNQHRGIIGSFRQNQHFVKQVSSQALHPAQRASTHEFNALQKGRRGAANTPITPVRKKKRASQDVTPSHGGVRKSVNSPLSSRRPRSRGNSTANANLLQTFARNPFDPFDE